MKYYAIPSNNSSVTEKHVVEDNILFTNPLAGKGLRTLILQNYLYDNLHMEVLYARFRCPDLYRVFSFDLALVLSCLDLSEIVNQ